MKNKTVNAIAATGCAAILSACSSSNSSDVGAQEERTLDINFAAEANNVAIDCDTQLTGLGTTPVNADVKEFRFYVHDVTMIDSDGGRHTLTLDATSWQYQNVALIDFTNKDTSCSGAAKDTNTTVSGSVTVPSAATLTGVEFTLGVPADLNHQDRATAAQPLDRTTMHWNWQNGYKFARLDVAPVGGPDAWNFHLGSTGCSGDPQLNETVTCTREDRPVITLDSFEAASDTIILDYGLLVENSDLSQDEGGALGCMSGATDPECAALFSALGMDLATGATDASLTQTVFRVE